MEGMKLNRLNNVTRNVLSDDTKIAGGRLLPMSLAAIFIGLTDSIPTKISWIGLELTDPLEQATLLIFLAILLIMYTTKFTLLRWRDEEQAKLERRIENAERTWNSKRAIDTNRESSTEESDRALEHEKREIVNTAFKSNVKIRSIGRGVEVLAPTLLGLIGSILLVWSGVCVLI